METDEIVMAGSLALWGEPEGAGLGQPGVDMTLGVSNSILQCLQGKHQGDRAMLFTVMHGRRIKDYMHKLKRERFRLNIRDIFSPWGQPSSEGDCPDRLCSLYSQRCTRPKSIKPGLSTELVLLWAGHWNRWPLKIPFNLNYPMIIYLHEKSTCGRCFLAKSLFQSWTSWKSKDRCV